VCGRGGGGTGRRRFLSVSLSCALIFRLRPCVCAGRTAGTGPLLLAEAWRASLTVTAETAGALWCNFGKEGVQRDNAGVWGGEEEGAEGEIVSVRSEHRLGGERSGMDQGLSDR